MLDVIGAEMTDDPAYAKVTFRTLDGSKFECFADGVMLKMLSDKFLAFAGHVLLATRGEAPDLEVRPLSELHDDGAEDADEPPPVPPLPDMRRPFRLEESERPIPAPPPTAPAPPQAPDPTEATGWEDPGKLAKPPEPLPISGFEHMSASHAVDRETIERTIDFVESFGGKPAAYFTDRVRTLVKETMRHVDAGDPAVQQIAKVAGIVP
jgi:hypothetical protein